MKERVSIALDCLGGDNGVEVVLAGADLALKADKNLELCLCGPAEPLEAFAATHERCKVYATTEEITMDEHPVRAVRSKKDSSLVRAASLVGKQEADGLFSAGSTGAVLAAATLIAGRIPGVARPCLATVAPGAKGPMVLCDIGANADVKPEYLVQFGQMASVYASLALDVEDPKIGLLNIGTEETKGNKLAQEAFALFKDVEGFAGNIESSQLFFTDIDVIVTDGFTGNTVLKTIEGTAKYLFTEIKTVFKSSLLTKLAALVLKNGLYQIKGKLDPDVYGGAPLLGVKGACLVGHGSSGPEAIKNGILQSAKTVRVGVSEAIEELFQKAE